MTNLIDETPGEATVFGWAKAYRDRMGEYPDVFSGLVISHVPESGTAFSWSGLDRYLRSGAADLPQGLSLESLIEGYHRATVPFTEKKIIRWANAHRRKHGAFPSRTAGKIEQIEARPATWTDVHSALVLGDRGLEGGRALEEFLQTSLEQTNTLSEAKVLAWADAYFDAHGSYPTRSATGEIPGSNGETWQSIDFALGKGIKGLPKRKPSDDLFFFIQRHRGAAKRQQPPKFSVLAVLAWAKAYEAAHGVWPTAASGAIDEESARGEKWCDVDAALAAGTRGFVGGSSLEKLLAEMLPTIAVASEREVPRGEGAVAGALRQPLAGTAHAGILSAHDQSKAPAGSLGASGAPVPGAAEARHDVAPAVVAQERTAGRGAGGDVAMVPKPRRRKSAAERPARTAPMFSPVDLLSWIERHMETTGMRPTATDGSIPGAPAGLTWSVVSDALLGGWGGHPPGTTLDRYIGELRFDHLPLSAEQIKHWVKLHWEHTGRWPKTGSDEPVRGAHGERWRDVAAALKAGRRALGPGAPKFAALVRQAQQEAGCTPTPTILPHIEGHRGTGTLLNSREILAFVDAFEKANGRLPRLSDGALPGTSGITWQGVNNLLKYKLAGLAESESLRSFLARYRGMRGDATPATVISKVQVRCWIDAYLDSAGEFPRVSSGRANGRHSWRQVSSWLAEQGESGLANFIYKEYGVIGRSPPALPRFAPPPGRGKATTRKAA